MIKIYDSGFRGTCPRESAEQKTFFNVIRRDYPSTYGKIAFHVRNEGKRTPAQAAKEKAEGLTSGVSDIIIPGFPTFVCELKRLDKTKCRIPDDELNFLRECDIQGCFAVICYGYLQAIEAFEDWKEIKLNP